MRRPDWQLWVDRWDRMQDRYLPARTERFDCLARIIRAVQPDPRIILDIGCGAGSLTLRLAQAFPDARIVGVDFDATLLALAQARCAELGDRVSFVEADLRSSLWHAQAPQTYSAAVSATALHWLSREKLRLLYADLARVLVPGGVFLNADHVGSDVCGIQRMWENRREQMRHASNSHADDWGTFWREYLAELGPEASRRRQEVQGPWQGIESGLPLWWHLEALREVGFEGVDCFWRLDGDAIYGGIRKADQPQTAAPQWRAR